MAENDVPAYEMIPFEDTCFFRVAEGQLSGYVFESNGGEFKESEEEDETLYVDFNANWAGRYDEDGNFLKLDDLDKDEKDWLLKSDTVNDILGRILHDELLRSLSQYEEDLENPEKQSE